jgi:hypothetical protein
METLHVVIAVIHFYYKKHTYGLPENYKSDFNWLYVLPLQLDTAQSLCFDYIKGQTDNENLLSHM